MRSAMVSMEAHFSLSSWVFLTGLELYSVRLSLENDLCCHTVF